MPSRYKLKVGISFFTVYFVWGSTYLATRISVDSIPPFFSMALRFLIAGILLGIWLVFKGNHQVSRKQVFNASFIGVLMIGVGCGPIAWAIQFVPSGVTAIVVAILPILFIIFEKLMEGSAQIKFSVWVGIVISLIGITLLSGFGDTDTVNQIPFIPFSMIILSLLFWAFASILGRKMEKPGDNLMDITIQLLSGGLFNLVVSVIIGEQMQLTSIPITMGSIVAILYLAVFGSVVVYAAYNFLIKNIRSGLVSTHCYINPIVAIILGWLFLGEQLNTKIVFSCCLILLGVVFIQKGYLQVGNIKIKKGTPT